MARNNYGNGIPKEIVDLAERIRRWIDLGAAGGGKGSRTLLSTKARDKDASDKIAALAERIRQGITSEARWTYAQRFYKSFDFRRNILLRPGIPIRKHKQCEA